MRRFTEEEKAKAIALYQSGEYTQQQAADAVGCSMFSLQDWIKAAKKGKNGKKNGKKLGRPANGQKPKAVEVETTAAPKSDIVRQFWGKNNRAVDMLLDPKDISSADVVKLVNEALQFAQDKK